MNNQSNCLLVCTCGYTLRGTMSKLEHKANYHIIYNRDGHKIKISTQPIGVM